MKASWNFLNSASVLSDRDSHCPNRLLPFYQVVGDLNWLLSIKVFKIWYKHTSNYKSNNTNNYNYPTNSNNPNVHQIVAIINSRNKEENHTDLTQMITHCGTINFKSLSNNSNQIIANNWDHIITTNLDQYLSNNHLSLNLVLR